MKKQYNEQDAEIFYDKENDKYQSFWDKEGSLHWGYFDGNEKKSSDQFLSACHNWNRYMLNKSKIDEKSNVLDLGCGNGTISLWIAEEKKCQVTGVDISKVRILNAINNAKNNSKIKFIKASASDSPFPDNHFTHVWSQAVIFHIPKTEELFKEVYRILKPGGVFIFDNLTQPTKKINESARKYVYNRLVYNSSLSHEEHFKALSDVGFNVIESMDISNHLRKSYELLTDKSAKDYPENSFAYKKMCQAIDEKQLGWSFFLTKK